MSENWKVVKEKLCCHISGAASYTLEVQKPEIVTLLHIRNTSEHYQNRKKQLLHCGGFAFFVYVSKDHVVFDFCGMLLFLAVPGCCFLSRPKRHRHVWNEDLLILWMPELTDADFEPV